MFCNVMFYTLTHIYLKKSQTFMHFNIVFFYVYMINASLTLYYLMFYYSYVNNTMETTVTRNEFVQYMYIFFISTCHCIVP